MKLTWFQLSSTLSPSKTRRAALAGARRRLSLKMNDFRPLWRSRRLRCERTVKLLLWYVIAAISRNLQNMGLCTASSLPANTASEIKEQTGVMSFWTKSDQNEDVFRSLNLIANCRAGASISTLHLSNTFLTAVFSPVSFLLFLFCYSEESTQHIFTYSSGCSLTVA